ILPRLPLLPRLPPPPLPPYTTLFRSPEPRFGLRVCTVHDSPRDQRWAATSLTVQTMSHTIHRLSPGTMFTPLRGAGSEKGGEPESALRVIRNRTPAGHCR